MQKNDVGTTPTGSDRRARRRQETIEEILVIAERLMAQDGVHALSLSEVARRLGVQPPSLYKYFPSLMAIYDALFERGQHAHLAAMRDAVRDAAPGLDALAAGLDASGRWLLANRAIAQLMFWRPVPNFEPSEAAMAPSHEMLALQRQAIADAVDAGQLGPAANSDRTIDLVSTLIIGVLSQAIANEPDCEWGSGRFTPLFPMLLGLLPVLYPPDARP